MDATLTFDRRAFLRGAAAALGGLAATGLAGGVVSLAEAGIATDYGPLAPTPDATTGLPLLQLPAGFSYASFGWTGDPLADGTPTPGAHDGMAVVGVRRGLVHLVRNHELRLAGTAFGPPALQYDPRGRGGTTTLVFDLAAGRWVDARVSLAGTSTNCAGGATPWGSWLTCEETVDVYDETHGWVFEVPREGTAVPEPLRGLGRFVHEAAAVDRRTGIVYETEDRPTAGFYRFLPSARGRLRRGGRLQMLAVAGEPRADLSTGVAVGTSFPVAWVDIDDPERAHSPGTADTLGVYRQGLAAGGATFRRLEGCWYGRRRVTFVSTTGGAAGQGQVWEYQPAAERLRLVFESPAAATMNNPDNVAGTRRGLVLCEDGFRTGQRLLGLDRRGNLFELARNDVVLAGEPNGLTGDFRWAEWAGATFVRKWLFANILVPGITVAITGPWRRGPL